MHLEALVKIGSLIGVTLVVRKNYQKQLFVVPPWSVIPVHRHTEVRSNIIFLEGLMIFQKSGREIELVSPQDSCRSFMIEPDEEHGARTQGQHGIFISEQYWLTEKPITSLHLNWTGQPINEDHAKQLLG